MSAIRAVRLLARAVRVRLLARTVPCVVLFALVSVPAHAAPTTLPPAAREADLEEQLGREVPRDLVFTDEDGGRFPFGEVFDGERPVVLVLAYYRCPMLCGLVLRGLVDGLNQLPYTLGLDYRALTVSIDPRDTPAAARAKRRNVLAAMARPGPPGGWPFLIGEPGAIGRIADAVGFRFAYDARSDQFAHPAAAIVLTPEGKVSRYLYGVSFSARDLRLALVEAGQGKTGTIVDRILMTCYHYDPATRAYGPYILGFIRIGGVLILAVVGGVVAILFRREARERRLRDAEGGR